MLTLLFRMTPAADIRNLAKIIYTIRAGQVVYQNREGPIAYSALIFAARMTLAQFSISTLMRVANSSGVVAIGS